MIKLCNFFNWLKMFWIELMGWKNILMLCCASVSHILFLHSLDKDQGLNFFLSKVRDKTFQISFSLWLFFIFWQKSRKLTTWIKLLKTFRTFTSSRHTYKTQTFAVQLLIVIDFSDPYPYILLFEGKFYLVGLVLKTSETFFKI